MNKKPRKVLCDRARNMKCIVVGSEEVCEIKDGRGNCGEDFFEEDGSYCRWCCQILEFDEQTNIKVG